MIGARGSLLSDVPSFHQKTRRWLSITYPGAALLLSKITPAKHYQNHVCFQKYKYKDHLV